MNQNTTLMHEPSFDSFIALLLFGSYDCQISMEMTPFTLVLEYKIDSI
jgi:hypothetical protein